MLASRMKKGTMNSPDAVTTELNHQSKLAFLIRLDCCAVVNLGVCFYKSATSCVD